MGIAPAKVMTYGIHTFLHLGYHLPIEYSDPDIEVGFIFMSPDLQAIYSYDGLWLSADIGDNAKVQDPKDFLTCEYYDVRAKYSDHTIAGLSYDNEGIYYEPHNYTCHLLPFSQTIMLWSSGVR
jgi:hypothetical protein